MMGTPLQVGDLKLGMKIEVRYGPDHVLARGEVVYIGQANLRQDIQPFDPPGAGQAVIIKQEDGNLYEGTVAQLGLTKYTEVLRTHTRTTEFERFSDPLTRCYLQGQEPGFLPEPLRHRPAVRPNTTPTVAAPPARPAHRTRDRNAARSPKDRITAALYDPEVRRMPKFVR